MKLNSISGNPMINKGTYRKTEKEAVINTSDSVKIGSKADNKSSINVGKALDTLFKGKSLTDKFDWKGKLHGKYPWGLQASEDGKKVIARDSDYLYCFDRKGKALWDVKLENTNMGVCESKGRVFTADNRNGLTCIDDKGKEVWSHKFEIALQHDPMMGGKDTLFATDRNHRIFAFNTDDGEVKWEYKNENPFIWKPLGHEDGSIVFATEMNKLVTLNPDGSVKWDKKLPGEDEIIRIISAGKNGNLYASGKKLYALDADGNIRWEKDNGKDSGPPFETSDGSVLQERDGSVVSFDSDGREKWSFKFDGESISLMNEGKDGLVYFYSDKALYAMQPDGKPKWTMDLNKLEEDDDIRRMTTGPKGDLYILTNFGNLYSIKTIEEKMQESMEEAREEAETPDKPAPEISVSEKSVTIGGVELKKGR